MPGGRSLNDRLQRRLGALRQPARNVLGKLENWKTGKLENWKTGRLEDWRLPLSYLRDREFSVLGATLLEIGTGWYPTLPICFSLAGAKTNHRIRYR